MRSVIAKGMFSPFRSVCREKLADGEIDPMCRSRILQMLSSPKLSEACCEEIERVARSHGMVPSISAAAFKHNDPSAVETIRNFIREHWDDLIIQALFFVLPMILGDEGEISNESEGERE